MDVCQALYPYLTLYLAVTNLFSDDEESWESEECWDTVLATISVAAVAQSCIVLAGTQGVRRKEYCHRPRPPRPAE